MGGFSPHPTPVCSGRANRVLAEQREKGLVETDSHLSADVLGCWKGADYVVVSYQLLCSVSVDGVGLELRKVSCFQ